MCVFILIICTCVHVGVFACVRACVRVCVYVCVCVRVCVYVCILITVCIHMHCTYAVTYSILPTISVPICCESVETCENAHGCLSFSNRPSCCCNYGYTLNAQNECIGECTPAALSLVGYKHAIKLT